MVSAPGICGLCSASVLARGAHHPAAHPRTRANHTHLAISSCAPFSSQGARFPRVIWAHSDRCGGNRAPGPRLGRTTAVLRP